MKILLTRETNSSWIMFEQSKLFEDKNNTKYKKKILDNCDNEISYLST